MRQVGVTGKASPECSLDYGKKTWGNDMTVRLLSSYKMYSQVYIQNLNLAMIGIQSFGRNKERQRPNILCATNI